MKVLVVALLVVSSVCVVWTSARTADTKRPNGAFTRLSGSESQPAQYVPGELIVKFRDAASAATIAAVHSAAGGRTHKIFSAGTSRLHHLKLNPGVVVEDAVSQYQQSPAVEYAEPNYLYQASMIPNDPQFTSLWGLHNTGQTVNGTAGTAGVDIDVPQAWDLTTGSPNVIIGVVDTGIAYDHPDLAPNMWINTGEIPNDGIDNDGNGFIDDVNGYDFVNDDPDPMDAPSLPLGNPGHGMHVAGTIAAVGNNGLGLTGVMHTARLMALKAGDVTNSFTSAAILQAADYARKNGARAINASFGRSAGPCSPAEYNMVSALNAAGVMLLVAAGNDNVNTDVTPSYPAQYSVATACGPGLPNVIAVAAIDQNSNRASFSNYGATSVQIAAPGVNINSTRPTSNFTSSFFHDYDSNPGNLGYTFTGTNSSWGFTNNVSLSPPTSLTDSPAGNYLNNSNSFATGPMFSTLGQRGCRLVGDIRYATELGFDGFFLDISRDGGATWTTMPGSISGSSGGTFVNVPFSDIPDRSANTRFRIHFISDSSIVDDGGYFDNVQVRCTSGAPSGTTDYQFLQGTSMATPHVTGVVGLLLAANPNLNVAQIRSAILNTGVPVPALNGVVSTGRRLNAFNAVSSVMQATFTVAVTKNGTGTGTVTSSPAGINCGGMCNVQFNQGTTVALFVSAGPGSLFAGWSGACSGTGPCVVSSDATVTATFNTALPPTFTVTINKAGTGTGSVTSNPAGITCGPICSAQFPGGTTVTLTATPDAGFIFSGWSGGGCAGAGTCQVATNATVTATFNVAPPTPFTVTVNKNGTGAGTVTSNPAGINCGGMCNAQFNQGTTVTLTATPSAGSVFAGWGGGCTGTGACQVATTVTVTATFNTLPPPGTFTVTTLKGGTGTGKVVSAPAGIDCGVTCSANFLNGTTVTLTETADAGSTFTGWSGGGCTGTDLCVVNTATTVTATFDVPASGGGAAQASSGGGGGCTIAQAGTSDALMPTLLLVTLGALIGRVRRRSN
jgi:subtilisin family serine protease/uncharacterized protein (DUF2141 family)